MFEQTVTTNRPFDEAVAAIEKTAAANGFRVLHVHDVAATLAEGISSGALEDN